MIHFMKFDFEKESKNPKIKRVIKEILIWLLEIAAVIFLAYFIVHFTLEKTEMMGTSMEGVLSEGDNLIVNKFTYVISDPKRFDLIVYRRLGNEHNYYEIRRVIGLPGETVQIINGDIYINGEKTYDPIIAEPMENYGLATEPIVLEENEYFVLGDNRNNCEDSRFASMGNVLRDEIVGKAWLRLSPFNFIGKLNMKKETTDISKTDESKKDTTK